MSKEAMKQGEPVAKVCHDLDGHIGWNPSLTELPDEGTELYTKPQQRKPLTREVIDRDFHGRVDFVRQVEAAHEIKE